MSTLIALGLGAGLVSALLFASAGTASVPAMLLMYLAPLPILIVALGWHHLLGLLALSTGALAVSFLLRSSAGTAFALGPGLGGWLLAYAALMHRPAPSRTDERGAPVEPADHWLSAGWLLLLVAIAATLIAVGALAGATGGDYESYEDALRRVIAALLRRDIPGSTRADGPPASDLLGSDFVRLVAAIAPALLSGMLTLILAGNLWSAGRVVAISGRLPRPWPDVPASRMPSASLVLWLAGALTAQLSGFVGVFGTAIVGGLTMAFALQGLALVHFVSRGRAGRGLILSVAYFLTFILGYLFLPAFALLGAVDTALPLRRMLGAGGRTPPPLPPPFT